ncbi:hypothetical protein BHU72_00125 [Desulfuribacillus stibiiarsenatis]|uniref:Fatty acid-binding protein DegV n=2 Tax=Desulfuribacillus stibiiarsenatis TaxID=1390249 RepID=A0A1E5L9N8_9FIRM|nr:hypothetical protein BHU72_00125 [Desulfuribacillus stibiiarsenatis]
MFGLVTDSTATLSEEEQSFSQAAIVPLSILLEGQSFREGIDITNHEFYDRIQKTKDIPKTSQPAVGDFIQAYNGLKEKGISEILSIHISTGISGTLNSAKAAAEQIKDLTVHFLDTKSLSRPIGHLVMKAANLREQGKSIEEVKSTLQEIIDSIRVYCSVGDLEFLHKGGRVSGVAYFLGSLLNICPIVFVNKEGVIVAHEKVRTFKKALDKLASYVEQAISEEKRPNLPLVNILHAANEKDALSLQNIILEKFPSIRTEVRSLTPVIGSHTGMGTIGLAILFDE